MGRMKNSWQERDYVLKFFGSTEGQAKRAYRSYVNKGIAQGNRPDLVGGGLVRSMGGWSAVRALRRAGVFEQGDERILGDGNFVKSLLDEADEIRKKQFVTHGKENEIQIFIDKFCKKRGINVNELSSGSKRAAVVKCRHQLAKLLIKEFSISMADIARRLGVGTSAISKILNSKS